MSSQFHSVSAMGVKLPFICWESFTVAEYLSATLALGAVVVSIFHGLAFAAGLVASDAYKGFLLFMIVAALNFEGLMLAGDYGQWLFYQLMQWTPVSLWWFQPLWFTDLGAGAVFSWQECRTAAVCVLLAVALCWIAFRRFRRKDIQ